MAGSDNSFPVHRGDARAAVRTETFGAAMWATERQMWHETGTRKDDMQSEATMRLDRAQVRELMALVLATRDKPLPDDDSTQLREIGFRSLDFSELALRVEDEIDRELNFDAPGLRSVLTVGDVLDLIERLQDGS
jgi:acyl carrier protein